MEATSSTWTGSPKDRYLAHHPFLEPSGSEDSLSIEAGDDTNLMEKPASRDSAFGFGLRKAGLHLPKSSSTWKRVALLVAGIVIISLIVVLTSVFAFRRETVWTNCGNSPSEARTRGCSFDILSHAWQTKECYDHETSEAFRQAGDWEYYLDRDAKYLLSEAMVMEGETDVWTRQSMHYVHCTYMWRQMHRAFTVLNHIDTHLNNWNHTLHCQQVFINPHDGELLEVLARVIYPSCHPV